LGFEFTVSPRIKEKPGSELASDTGRPEIPGF